MITQKNRDDLLHKGYTVVPGVLTEAECDQHVASYRKWLNSFPQGTYPEIFESLMKYQTGHMEPSWSIRLKAYPVFTQLWKTEKLFTSFDAIAIGRPPETGLEEFWSPESGWLHSDQHFYRLGLHGYQGSVYLEDCDEDDWTFEILEGSHKVFDELENRLQTERCVNLSGEDLEWLAERGCVRKRVPCPKGGMLLWDARLIHANARPIKGRKHGDRWRYVSFVCMTPAAWASASTLEARTRAYNNLILTGHWASMGIHFHDVNLQEGSVEDPNPLKKLPDIATSDIAKRISGVLPYENVSEDLIKLPKPKYKEGTDIEEGYIWIGRVKT